MRFRQVAPHAYQVNAAGLGRVGYVTQGWGPYHWTPHLTDAPTDFGLGFRGQYRTRLAAAQRLVQEANGTGTDAHTTRRTSSTRAPRVRATSGDRAFGIELELTGPDNVTVARALEAQGIRVTDRHTSYAATTGEVDAWELKHDGSVAGYGLELVSPKLYGEAGIEQIRKVCRALNSVEAHVDRSCGFHLHMDMGGYDLGQIRSRALMFLERQDLIAQLVAPSRRHNHYSEPWSVTQIEQLKAFTTTVSRSGVGRTLRDISYIGPRGALNLQAYARHGSMEIRWHGGTTSFARISAWVKFIQVLFSDRAVRLDDQVSKTSVRQMLTDLGIQDSQTLDTLLRFRAAADSAEVSLESTDFAEVAR